MSVKFYICNHCKNIITKMNDSGVPVVCCGEKMTELIPGTSDGAHEKHVPAFELNGNKVSVKVGSVEHPMMEKHYIQWILIETNFGTHCRSLTPEDKPEAEFFLADGALIAETLEFHLGADHLMFQTVCLFFHALFVGCKCLRTLFFFKIIIRQIQISHNTLVVFRHFQKSRLRLESRREIVA